MKIIQLVFCLVTFASVIATIGCGDSQPDPKSPSAPTSTDPADRRPMQ